MFTLKSHPEELLQHPLNETNQLCRTTLRLRQWGDETVGELLSRPPQRATLDACRNAREKLWHLCDDDLKEKILLVLGAASA